MNHDITHCDNQKCNKCNKCYRYVALKALKKENAKLPKEKQIPYVSMLCDTDDCCIKQDYKFFMEL